MKIFLRKYPCGALASSVYYLTIAKYSRENFHGTLTNRENHESLAHQIFSIYGILFMKLCILINDRNNVIQDYWQAECLAGVV